MLGRGDFSAFYTLHSSPNLDKKTRKEGKNKTLWIPRTFSRTPAVLIPRLQCGRAHLHCSEAAGLGAYRKRTGFQPEAKGTEGHSHADIEG